MPSASPKNSVQIFLKTPIMMQGTFWMYFLCVCFGGVFLVVVIVVLFCFCFCVCAAIQSVKILSWSSLKVVHSSEMGHILRMKPEYQQNECLIKTIILVPAASNQLFLFSSSKRPRLTTANYIVARSGNQLFLSEIWLILSWKNKYTSTMKEIGRRISRCLLSWCE